MVQQLRQIRDFRTQKEMARLLAISQTYYSQLELGVRSPSRVLLRRMSNVFQISVDHLMTWWPENVPADVSSIPDPDPRRVAHGAK